MGKSASDAQFALMRWNDPTKLRREPPIFPYQLEWETLDDKWVTLDDLRENAERYAFLFDLLRDKPGTPFVDRSLLGEITASLSISPEAKGELIEGAFLIAGWYLAPSHRTLVQSDLVSTRAKLERIASTSQELYELLGQIAPNVIAAMQFVRAVEPQVFDERSPISDLMLQRELHDLALVAARIAADAVPTGGRKREYVRDTALRLAMEAVEHAGCKPVTISRREGDPWRFAGEAGDFMRKLFALIAPRLHEQTLAKVADRVRRNANKRVPFSIGQTRVRTY